MGVWIARSCRVEGVGKNGVWMVCECDWYDVVCDCAPDSDTV